MVGVYANPVVQLVMQSDVVTKLVLLILLVLSIISWALFIYKLVLGSAKQRHLKQAISDLKRVATFDEVRAIAGMHANTIPGYIMAQNLKLLKAMLEKRQHFSALTDRESTMMEADLQHIVDDVLHTEEQYLSFFSATAAVSPLLGLFGTVWGLIHSFIRISEKQSADIPTVAPGIAEALITTLAGLMVAIPALMMFHYLNNRLKTFEYYLCTLSDKLTLSVHTLFLS